MALKQPKTRRGRVDWYAPRRGAQAVINHFVVKHGGLRFLADFLNDRTSKKLYYYDIANWRERGSVSLDYVTEVAKVLKISPYLLAFTKLSAMKNTQPSWEKLVRETFTEGEADYILSLPTPKFKKVKK